jgi:hypothetical protein
VPVVVNKQLVTESLGIDDEAAGSIRSKPHDLANNPIAGDFDRSKVALRLKSGCSSRD